MKETPFRGVARALADVAARLRGLSRLARGTRAAARVASARRSRSRSASARVLGVPVASWVVLEDLRPAPTAAFALDAAQPAPSEVLDALAHLAIALHRAGVDHGDLKGTHVLLRRAATGLVPRADRPRRRALPAAALATRAALRALAELNASLPDAYPARAAAAARSARYAAALPFATAGAARWRAIVRESLAREHRWTGAGCERARRGLLALLHHQPLEVARRAGDLAAVAVREAQRGAGLGRRDDLAERVDLARRDRRGCCRGRRSRRVGFCAAITFSTSVASVKSLPMPSTASTEKRGTGTSASEKVYSSRMDSPGCGARQLRPAMGGVKPTSGSARKQRLRAVARVDERGASLRQRANASGQRVWKRQPGGGCSGDGTSPRARTATLRRDGSTDGTAASSARVYGMPRLARRRARSAPPRRSARGTSPRRGGRGSAPRRDRG